MKRYSTLAGQIALGGLLIVLVFLWSLHREKPVISKTMCRVVQSVYANGWKTCGEVTLYSDATYTWYDRDVWHAAKSIRMHTGHLNTKIFETLKSSVATDSRWKSVNGIPTAVMFMDDTKM